MKKLLIQLLVGLTDSFAKPVKKEPVDISRRDFELLTLRTWNERRLDHRFPDE